MCKLLHYSAEILILIPFTSKFCSYASWYKVINMGVGVYAQELTWRCSGAVEIKLNIVIIDISVSGNIKCPKKDSFLLFCKFLEY